jgi:hypothetical protein
MHLLRANKVLSSNHQINIALKDTESICVREYKTTVPTANVRSKKTLFGDVKLLLLFSAMKDVAITCVKNAM